MTDDHTADRRLTVSLSKNGSKTYSDPRYMNLPETGDFDARIVCKRWGQLRRGVVRIECTSPVDVTLIAASFEAS